MVRHRTVARADERLLHHLLPVVSVADFLLRLLAAAWADYRHRAVYRRLVVKAAFLHLVEVRVAFHLPEEVLADVLLADTVDALLAVGEDNKVADNPGSSPAVSRASRDSRSTRGCDSRSRRRPSASPNRSPSRNNCC